MAVAGGQRGPTNVGYVVVQLGSAPIEQELPGRVAAFQVSEVRPQVSGVIQQPAVPRRIDRPPRTDPLSDRPEHL